jgi:hypothetical protein
MLLRQCQVSEGGLSLDAEAMCDLRVPGHATHQCTGRARAGASVALAEPQDEKWDESLEASDEHRLVKPIIEIR